MNNLLVAIGVLIVAVLSALFAVPYFVDWNSYRGVIEEEASRVLGRDVRIGGDITAQLLPAPAFAIQKLRVADTATGSGEPLFRAERFDVRLSVVPLFRGVLEASQIELVRPALRLTVDETGQGNWRSIVQRPGSLPFTPSAVALQSVKITDGTVSAFDQRGARERLRLERIEGQLSAPALEGPYRFRGTFGPADATRDLRFTTLPPDADGTVQIKAGLKDLASGASATLDGRLRDPGGKPEITGDLSAQLPLVPTNRPEGSKRDASSQGPTAELKATLVGTVRQIALNQLSLAFESSGRPEVLTGAATFDFDGERRTTATLATPWIDLDNVLANPEGGNPLAAVADLAQRINALAGAVGNATATVQIDQANLGRELISGLHLEARSSAGLMAVEQLRAYLPGASKLELQGRIVGDGGATTFDGDMTLRGTSLARLAAWASAGRTIVDPVSDVPFEARARVTAEPARGGLRNIAAQVGDSALGGEIDYAWKGARALRITLSGPRIDARILAPPKTTLRALADKLTPTAPATPAATSAAATPGQPALNDLSIALTLDTPELVLPDRTLTDVAMSFESTARGLAFDRLQFSGDHGLAVSMTGRMGGPLSGSLATADTDGLTTLSTFIGFPLATVLPPSLAPELFPLRLAGTVSPRTEAGAKGVDITADGRAGTVDAKVRVGLTGGLDDWRSAPVDLDVVLMAPPSARLAARALAALRGQPVQAGRDGLAATLAATTAKADKSPSDAATPITRLALRAVGVPADGLSTAVRFDSPDVTALLDGSTRLTPTASVQLTGDLTLDARDGRDAVAAAGGLDLALADPLVLQGKAHVSSHDGALALTRIALTANGSALTGRLDVDPPMPTTSAPRRITGDLSFAALDASALLAPVLQSRPAEAQAAIQVTSGRVGVWPDANFDFARNRSITTDIGLKLGRLTLAAGVGLADVSGRLVTRPAAMEIRDLAGSTLGGRLSFNGVVEATPTGGMLTAKLGLEAADLSHFGGNGTADAVISVTGTGLSPAGLASTLTGSGNVTLTSASVRATSPATLQSAIETAFKAPPDKVVPALRDALAAPAASSPVAIGPRSVALAVQDGAARIRPITLQIAPGRITTQATFDLVTLQTTGDWRVETRLPPLPPLPLLPGEAAPPPTPTSAALLPPLVERFTLQPADIGQDRKTRQPAPETAALERELAVRKVERDLAELERLRRLDEERAAAQKAAAAEAEWARQTTTQTLPATPPSAPPPAAPP